jgi:hypothetical protein
VVALRTGPIAVRICQHNLALEMAKIPALTVSAYRTSVRFDGAHGAFSWRMRPRSRHSGGGTLIAFCVGHEMQLVRFAQIATRIDGAVTVTVVFVLLAYFK